MNRQHAQCFDIVVNDKKRTEFKQLCSKNF